MFSTRLLQSIKTRGTWNICSQIRRKLQTPPDGPITFLVGILFFSIKTTIVIDEYGMIIELSSRI